MKKLLLSFPDEYLVAALTIVGTNSTGGYNVFTNAFDLKNVETHAEIVKESDEKVYLKERQEGPNDKTD